MRKCLRTRGRRLYPGPSAPRFRVALTCNDTTRALGRGPAPCVPPARIRITPTTRQRKRNPARFQTPRSISMCSCENNARSQQSPVFKSKRDSKACQHVPTALAESARTNVLQSSTWWRPQPTSPSNPKPTHTNVVCSGVCSVDTFYAVKPQETTFGVDGTRLSI
jgi:hypothetical protein